MQTPCIGFCWRIRQEGSRYLNASTPDAAILLAGLDKLCEGVMAAHTQLSFRCSMSRSTSQLDFGPTVDTGMVFARFQQAEMETLALSFRDRDLGQDKNKKAKVAALKGAEGKGEPKGEQTGKAVGNQTNAGQQGRDGEKDEGGNLIRSLASEGRLSTS